MKLMHKILLSLVVVSAIAPSSMQANALTRVVNKQNLLAVVRHPSMVWAGLSAASLAYTKFNERRRYNHITTMKQTEANRKITAQIQKQIDQGKFFSKAFGLTAVNHILLLGLQKRGYLEYKGKNSLLAGLAALSATVGIFPGIEDTKFHKEYMNRHPLLVGCCVELLAFSLLFLQQTHWHFYSQRLAQAFAARS